jgi:hypothetical protein
MCTTSISPPNWVNPGIHGARKSANLSEGSFLQTDSFVENLQNIKLPTTGNNVNIFKSTVFSGGTCTSPR